MTTDEQRIFVAEWMGFDTTWLKDTLDRYLILVKESDRQRACEAVFQLSKIPHLTLDWLHECENKLSNLDHQKFCLFLHKQVMGTLDNFDVNGTCNLECISRVVKASAEQRLAALVETITSTSSGAERKK